MPSSLPSVSVIVPTFREAENLPLLIPRVAAALLGSVWELIVVDDNSRDGTVEAITQLQQNYPQVRCVVRTQERGLSSAVLAGIAEARHDVIAVMDADLSHPPEAIPALVNRLSRGDADFVIGSRYVAGGGTEDWSRLRWLNSAGATLLAKPLVGEVRDPMAGFFALRREALGCAAPLSPIGYKIALELIVKLGIPAEHVAEVPITFRNRIHGQSKLTVKEQFRYLEHLSRLYDFKFPKGSPRVKFFIAGGCSAVAFAAVLAAMVGLRIPQAAALAGGLVAMTLVTLAFFIRYVRTQRAFIVMRRPFMEFAGISAAECIGGWGAAMLVSANVLVQACAALAIVMLARYTLRKVFLHDLRGIRGARTGPVAPVALAPATAPVVVSAKSA